jgi:hypothetical protein
MRNIFVALIVLAGTGAAIVGGPFYALLFYLWNAYFRPQEWVFSDWVFSLRLSYTLAAILPVTIVLWGQRLRFNRGLILPALFVVVAGLSAGMSDYSDRALDYFYDFGRIAFITFVIATITDDMKKLRLVFMTIAFSLGFEAVKQGFATMILSPGGANRNTIYFLGDNNGVGLGMLLLTTIFVALAQTSEGPLQRTLFRFGALGVCYRAISTYSRGAFIAGALSLCSTWRARASLEDCRRHRRGLPDDPAADAERVLERMETITAGQEERDSSASERLHLWGVGLKMAQANPIVGVGFNSFRYAVSVYDTEVTYEGEKAPHSSWIGVLSEMAYWPDSLFPGAVPGVRGGAALATVAPGPPRRQGRSRFRPGTAGLRHRDRRRRDLPAHSVHRDALAPRRPFHRPGYDSEDALGGDGPAAWSARHKPAGRTAGVGSRGKGGLRNGVRPSTIAAHAVRRQAALTPCARPRRERSPPSGCFADRRRISSARSRAQRSRSHA